jgi:hypothetical protein
LVDNQQAVTTLVYNATDAAVQWIREMFDRWMTELQRQIYPNIPQSFNYYNPLSYLPTWWLHNPDYTADKTR